MNMFRALCALVLTSVPGFAEVVEVEGQPLASNVRRVVQALDYLGAPLPKSTKAKLATPLEKLDSAAIQQALGPLVSLELSIDKNGSLTTQAQRPLNLQQAGFTPVLLKVVNHAESMKQIRIHSPQAGPVYSGVSQFSLGRQQQTTLGDRPGPTDKRFLTVAMFDSSPLNRRLSGLRVEYALALIYSRDAGNRQVELGFALDAKQKPKLAKVDLQIEKAIQVRLRIEDFDGKPTMAKLLFRNAAGQVFPAQALRLAPDLFFQPYIYRADGEFVWLPPGKLSVSYSRGPEYRVLQKVVEIPATGNPQLSFRLQRWINPNQLGYYSGDHHIHAAGCAHYTSPTQGIEPKDMFRQVKGEGLNVGCVLTWGPCFDHQRNYFSPTAATVSEADTLLKYDLEISGFGSQALGHVCLLNLRDQTYPGSEGRSDRGWPTWTTPVLRWAKKQGGVTGYAHSASGLAIAPQRATARLFKSLDKNGDGFLTRVEAAAGLLPATFKTIDRDRDQRIAPIEMVIAHRQVAEQLPNLAVPEMNGVGAMEICVSVSEGVCDFISAMDTARIAEWNMWYHILNCGFPLKVSGETDFPCMSSRRVGQGRVYVRLGETRQLDFRRWVQGLAKGQSYVSDGFAHPIDFEVKGVRPGEKDVQLPSDGGKITVTAKVAFAEQTPLAVAHGGLVPVTGKAVVGDTVLLHAKRTERIQRGGSRNVELIVNGRVVKTQPVPADGKLHSVQFEVDIDRSSWVAIRHFPQFHTNPVNVLVGGKPIRASRESALWCAQSIRVLWQSRQNQIAPHERAAAKATFDKAIQRYVEIAADQE